MKIAPAKYYVTVVGASLSWFALIFQFYLIINNRPASQTIGETVARYLTYYTILTNLLVAVCFTAEVIHKNRQQSFFTQPETLAATTVYIGVVGLVYNVILRYQWQPIGLQRVVDELLHLIIPIYFMLYWLLLAPKAKIKWSNLLTWLLYPAIYLIVIMLRGTYTSYYPYPFVSVTDLGYQKVIVNCVFVLLAFIIASLAVILVSRKLAKPPLKKVY